MGLVTYFVTNGSAKGCSLSHGTLSATSQGTCVVTATKASDGTYAAISTTATSVSMAVPARPRTLTVEFKVGSAALTSAARSELATLAKELVKGATITVTGYAKGNAALARSRATAVANLLKSKAHATIKTVTTSSANSTTVVTTKQ
jgi:outer membrane protein OmpA-like peptidoglycan-associated protein